MKILILGGSGYIGKRLADMLRATAWAVPVMGSRKPRDAATSGTSSVVVDTCNLTALTETLRGMDAVVNCVAGDEHSIAEGARVMVQAARDVHCRRIVQLSTMSVYGPREGLVREDSPLDPGLGWYGRAKCQAEHHVVGFSRQGGEAVIVRPGCVFGPGSELWVGRVGRWLQARRLGDLGIGGDGWSNLVHVDDVCRAVMASLQLPVRRNDVPVFNLAAPDSPRWNTYFVDLALSIAATPVKRISSRQIQCDTLLLSPPLKVAQRVLVKLGVGRNMLADPMPPGLARLWSQHIQLDASRASRELGITWTPYCVALENSASWFLNRGALTDGQMGKAVCTR